MSHILIAGGTGMLKNVSIYHAKHAVNISVIARSQTGFDNLISEKTGPGFINPIKVDYSNSKLLKEKIISAIDSLEI